MLYSFIVSIYNVETYLRQCIDSILAQTYTDFEVILVDDGSPDKCAEICDEYAVKDSRVKVVHKENSGLISTRKIGVAIAEGQYVCFVDGDDVIKRDMLETYEEILKQNEVDVICTGLTEFYENYENTVHQGISCGIYKKKEMVESIYPKMLSVDPFFSFGIIPSVCAKCFKKTIIKKIYREIPDDITLGEDVAASYPALLQADTIYVAEYYGYMYRKNQASMTHTYNKNLFNNLKHLLVYLRSCAKTLQWNATSQINEYTVYLLHLAMNNEFYYNTGSKYFTKRKRMLMYLKDEIFSSAVENIEKKISL